MKIYVFNPEHDMALASFSPHYKAPAEIIRMRNDLSVLPVWYAERGEVVSVHSDDCIVSFKDLCRKNGVVPWGKCVEENECLRMAEAATLPEKDGGLSSCISYFPWGWDPALAHSLDQSASMYELLPDSNELQRIRILSGRQQCVSVLNDFQTMPEVCGEAKVCVSLDEVHEFLITHQDVILKAPWSGSGRGLVRTSQDTWTPNLEGWVARILRTQEAIMAEPIYNKVYDFAMEFRMDESHQLSFAGYSLFETDSHGNYKENLLTSNERIVEILSQYVSTERLEAVKRQLIFSLTNLLSADYVGYFGVDMMICKQDDAQQSCTYLIHPCVEINLRMNMGVVARLLFDRYMDKRSEGSYVVEHYSKDGEALVCDQKLRDLYPARVECGKMVEGYFTLTPVVSSTRYQCYVICKVRN